MQEPVAQLFFWPLHYETTPKQFCRPTKRFEDLRGSFSKHFLDILATIKNHIKNDQDCNTHVKPKNQTNKQKQNPLEPKHRVAITDCCTSVTSKNATWMKVLST